MDQNGALEQIIRGLPLDRLHPWRHNFRFVEGQLGAALSDAETLRRIAEEDPVEVLVELLAEGYDESMPMVVVAESAAGEGSRRDHYTVMVGNRRLTAAALLLDPAMADGLRNERVYKALLERLGNANVEPLRWLPCVIKDDYESALESVRLSESGDIATGKSRWSPRATARYLDDLWRKLGRARALDVARSQDNSSASRIVRQIWAWRLWQLAKRHGHELSPDRFSIMSEHLLNRRNIIAYFGLPNSTVEWADSSFVPKGREEELTEFLAFAVGSASQPTVLPNRAYQQSDRDRLLDVFRAGGAALRTLRETGDLRAAHRQVDPIAPLGARGRNPIRGLQTAATASEGALSILGPELSVTDRQVLYELTGRFSDIAHRIADLAGRPIDEG